MRTVIHRTTSATARKMSAKKKNVDIARLRGLPMVPTTDGRFCARRLRRRMRGVGERVRAPRAGTGAQGGLRGPSTQIRTVATHAACAVTFIPSALRTPKNVESFG